MQARSMSALGLGCVKTILRVDSNRPLLAHERVVEAARAILLLR